MTRRLTCGSAPGGSRTPNLLIRSQMLYPLSYRRREATLPVADFAPIAVNDALPGACSRVQLRPCSARTHILGWSRIDDGPTSSR
jgi:hypothetical protein